MIAVTVMSRSPVAFFDFLQLGPLFRREIRRNFTMCFVESLVNAPAGFGPDRFELKRGFINDGRDFFYLFVC